MAKNIDKNSFIVSFADNERFSQETYDFLLENGFQVNKMRMEAGDIWISVLDEGEQFVIAIIEVKSIPDLIQCLFGSHFHLRSQINTMHSSTEKLKLKKILSIGNLDRLSPEERKVMNTLSIRFDHFSFFSFDRHPFTMPPLYRTEMEHPEKVTVSNISCLKELPDYLLEIVYCFKEWGEKPREFPNVERLNHSLKRNKGDSPESFLQLHLMEVARVGENKAREIAYEFKSINNLIDDATEKGAFFLTKKHGRSFLGDELSKKVYLSFGLELIATETKVRKRKVTAKDVVEDWPEIEEPLQIQEPKTKKPKSDKQAKKDKEAMDKFRSLTGTKRKILSDDDEDDRLPTKKEAKCDPIVFTDDDSDF
jgi:ERCC4-type nuclease